MSEATTSDAIPPEVTITVGSSAIDPRDPLAEVRAEVDNLLAIKWEVASEDVRCAAWNHAREMAAMFGNWAKNMAQTIRDAETGEYKRRGGPGEFTAADWSDAVARANQPGAA